MGDAVDVDEATTRLSRRLQRVEAGEGIVERARPRDVVLDLRDALAARERPRIHVDPPARGIAAQALCRNATPRTGDARLAQHPIAVHRL
jgi:PIN domain nuclease of toxin-antitoxin system